MMVLGNTMSQAGKCTLGAVFLMAGISSLNAQTPVPYLLPYTINTIVGGGTAPTLGAACPGAIGTAGNTGTATDTVGDGCLASSSSVVTSTDVHDVGVDPEGNVYFIDNGSSDLIRRIDGHSGLVTLFAGSGKTTVCANAIDKFGDNCPASDGAGSINGGFTSLETSRGLAVSKNGDVYLAHYTASLVHKFSASTGLMTLVAGALTGAGSKASGTKGYTGDGGLANVAEVNAPRGVVADAAGNVYFADSGNNVVRMVNTAGIISTIVGKYPGSNTNATAGYGGDGGPATSALLTTPEDVEVDANGNLFIADQGNARVRVVYAGGAQVAALIAATNGNAVAVPGDIYTIMGMGSGTSTYTPNNVVLATSVIIGAPRKIALDARGNIYLADNGNDVIWFEDGTTGYMRVIAGTFGKTSGGAGCGQSSSIGDNCLATLATLNPNNAMGVGVDGQGNVYISDSDNSRVRKVSLNQNFPTVNSGSSTTQTLILHFAVGDTQAVASPFTVTGSADFVANGPASCITNPDNTADCTITVAFAPTKPGIDVATLTVTSARGATSTFALSGVGAAAAVALDPGTTTSIGTGYKSPVGIALDAAGNTYIADTGDNVVIRYNNAGNGMIIAGTGTAGNSGNGGAATAATLSAPSAVTVTPDGAVYIADTGNGVVRRIDPVSGVINVAAGGATATCAAALDAFGNGCLGTLAKLYAPAGLASDAHGNVYISDTGNNVIRELTSSGYIFAISGQVFSGPTSLQVDPYSNVFVADTGHNTISEIIAGTSKVVAVAGNGQNGSSGNGGPATGAELSSPTGIALDAAGNIYIADTGNQVIRLVNAAGVINTTAGTLGQSGTGTFPGAADALLLSLPGGVASTTSGTLYVLDSGNDRAFFINRTSVVENLGLAAANASSPVKTIQETSTGSVTATLPQPSLYNVTGNTTVFTLTPQSSQGCSPGESLTPGDTCYLAAQFNPVAVGNFSATFTDAGIQPALPAAPSIMLSGTGAILTATSSKTVITSPATGNPQYSVAFTVTTTVTPVQCNTSAPSCIPTGTVQFFVGTTPVGIPVTLNNTGAASTSINGQNVGTLTVTAVYSGDLFYATSTAPPLSVTVTTGSTNTAVTLSAASVPQFQPLTITAKVTSATGGTPTGTVTFFADGAVIGTAALNSSGAASISDPQLIGANGKPISPVPTPNSFGLLAGNHAITIAYSGDANYTKSTSPATTLMIQPDAAGFAAAFISPTTLAPVSSLSAGTAQGSTALATVMVTPTNTLNGTVSFACSGLPANSVCTVAPTTLVFMPVPGVPTALTVGVTLWTDVGPGVIPTATTTSRVVRPVDLSARSNNALAAVLGWPVFLISFAGILGFRKRLKTRLFALLILCGLLTGGSLVMSGCSSGTKGSGNLTPTGVYSVSLTVSGPNNTSQTLPIQFTVATGVAGQE
jgi:sugar lactone lactonase YvrE